MNILKSVRRRGINNDLVFTVLLIITFVVVTGLFLNNVYAEEGENNNCDVHSWEYIYGEWRSAGPTQHVRSVDMYCTKCGAH
ncbi:MAG: hypothetical protein GX175_07985 [Halanaerobiaceae bacterium]|jgi:hypothetical protein|nr:hypothetical protein [Halanaerobiaceae bacterium]